MCACMDTCLPAVERKKNCSQQQHSAASHLRDRDRLLGTTNRDASAVDAASLLLAQMLIKLTQQPWLEFLG